MNEPVQDGRFVMVVHDASSKEYRVLHRSATSRMRIFYIIWFGQVISQLGSGLTAFALGVWVYQQTGVATQLTLISFFSTLPLVAFLPIAGVLIDRWDRRLVLILSDTGAVLTPLILMLLLLLGQLEIWHIYLVITVSACFRAFQFPAFSAASTLLVPKDQLGRASGMVQLGFGIAQLLSPVLGGVLLALIQLRGIFLIDLITFVVSVASLLFVRIPRPTSIEGLSARAPLLQDLTFGWRYIVRRSGLLGLLVLLGVSNFLLGIVIALAPPLILSFTSADVLGIVLSVAGSGMLVSSIVMSIWRGPRRRVPAVLVGVLMSGIGMVLASLAPSSILISVAAFFGIAGGPIVSASSQAIWQRKVAPDIQGRVFATRAVIATCSGPLAYLVSGPLADYVFNPLLLSDGPLAGSVGRVIGVGPGRGIAFLFFVLGVLGILAVIAAYCYAPLRLVEDELPDALPDEVSGGVMAT